MAIFNSYVKLPEGILNRKIMDNDDSAVDLGLSMAMIFLGTHLLKLVPKELRKIDRMIE